MFAMPIIIALDDNAFYEFVEKRVFICDRRYDNEVFICDTNCRTMGDYTSAYSGLM